MKKLLILAGMTLITTLSSRAVDIVITNITKATTIASTDYVLGLTNVAITGGKTRLLPVSQFGKQVSAGTNIFITTNGSVVTIAASDILWGNNAGQITNVFSKGNLYFTAAGAMTIAAGFTSDQVNASHVILSSSISSPSYLDSVNPTAANQTVYASGTAYTLTGTAAALDFGTTDPTITVSGAGVYLILANVGVKYSGATYATPQTITVKLRRTNNTAADLTNGGRTVELPVLTTFTGGDVISVPPIIYTATTGDVITIFGVLSATPSAGSVVTDSAEIVMMRVLP